MPNVRLQPSHKRRVARCRSYSKHRARERTQLDRVAKSGARAVRLYHEYHLRRPASVCKSGKEEALLCLAVGCRQAGAPSVLPHCYPDHPARRLIDGRSAPDGSRNACFAARISVRARIKGVGSPPSRSYPGNGKGCGDARGEHEVDAHGDT